MKLIECYIENFGKLHQHNYKFKDGLNIISELNGWGKSTFAAFIRAIFYGMEVTHTKKNLDDRRKYKPWQGGKYGGYIIFELNNKEYKVERFFGDKEKEDSFSVYDQGTGLLSDEFTENIGEEIFKLDKTAYSRSTYIPQNSITIEGANDSINAKLSNLIENDNDINNYDSAMELLSKCRREYVKTNKKGKLDVIRNKIASLNDDLKVCESKSEAVKEWNYKLEGIITTKKAIRTKLQSVKGQIEDTSRYEGQAAKLQQYNILCDDEKKTQAEYEPLITFFHDDIPTNEELKKCDEISSDILKVQGELKTYELTDYEKHKREELKVYFDNGIPEEKDILDCENQIALHRENKIKLSAKELTDAEKFKKAELDRFFLKGVPEDSEIDGFIDKIPKLNELKSNITTEKSKLEILKNVQVLNNSQKKEVKGSGLLITALAGIILGIILMFLVPFVGVGFIAAGIIILFVSKSIEKQMSSAASEADSKAAEQQKSNQEIQDFIEELTVQKNLLEEDLKNFLLRFSIEINPGNYFSSLTTVKTKASEYKNIVKKLDNQERTAIESMQNDIMIKIDNFLRPYCDALKVSIEMKDFRLKEVKSNRTEYLNICGKLSKFEHTNIRLKDLKSELYKILNKYFNEIDENPVADVNTLKEKCKDYQHLTMHLQECRAIKGQFEKENDVDMFINIKVPENTLKELQDSEKKLDSELESIIDEENNVKKQIADISDDADRCSDIQAEIEQIEEELKNGEKRLYILDETRDCLENAKNNFASHYMDNMCKGFEQYLDMLDNGTLGETHMDVKLNVSITEYGSQKSLDYFSTGYRDLIGICTRLALIDALFENERPFIILDDPFVNLDGEKLKNVLSMIKEVSKRYQTIYFVCHDSRVISKC